MVATSRLVGDETRRVQARELEAGYPKAVLGVGIKPLLGRFYKWQTCVSPGSLLGSIPR